MFGGREADDDGLEVGGSLCGGVHFDNFLAVRYRWRTPNVASASIIGLLALSVVLEVEAETGGVETESGGVEADGWSGIKFPVVLPEGCRV